MSSLLRADTLLLATWMVFAAPRFSYETVRPVDALDILELVSRQHGKVVTGVS